MSNTATTVLAIAVGTRCSASIRSAKSIHYSNVASARTNMTINELKEYIRVRSKLMQVEFDEEAHTYTHPVKGLLTGVSTIKDVRAKDWLKMWTTKENHDYMVAHWDVNKTYTEQEKLELLKLAKDAHAAKSQNAMNLGKQVHLWIEQYIAGENPDMPEEANTVRMIQSFLKWEQDHNVKWVVSELLVASLQHEFAGTLDAVALVDEKLVLMDFKTSSQISEEYYLQTAGYQICTDEMGIPIAERSILRIPKEKKDDLEYVIVPTPYEFDKETFLHLREVHRWNVYIANRTKNPYKMGRFARKQVAIKN